MANTAASSGSVPCPLVLALHSFAAQRTNCSTAAYMNEITPHTSPPASTGLKAHWMLAIAMLIVVFGSSGPLYFISDLRSVPNGTGIRPMGWPVLILFYGLGTPLLTAIVLRAAIKKDRLSKTSTLYKSVIKVTAFAIGIAAFAPLVLSTVVAHNIVKSQELWLKP